MLTFLYKPYIYFGLVIKLDGEIRKNLYTLYYKQFEILEDEKNQRIQAEAKKTMFKIEDAMLDKMNNAMNN